MTETRDQLAALASSAGKEISRLARVESVDARDELRFRVWPFLAELIDVVQAGRDEAELPATIPVDLVARTVGLLLSMANRLGEVLPAAEMNRFAQAAAEVTEELMALCDPDELAEFIHEAGAQPTIIAGPADGDVIDAEVVDSDAESEVPEAISEEQPAS